MNTITLNGLYLFMLYSLIATGRTQNGRPYIINKVNSAVVQKGQDATLHCTVGNFIVDRTSIQWFRLKPYLQISDNDVIKAGNTENKFNVKISVDGDARTSSLTVKRIDDVDVTIYRCRVSIQSVPYTEWPKIDAQILISEPPRFVPFLMTEFVGDMGGFVDLICRANGSPQPRIMWYKDDLNLQVGEGEVLHLTKLSMTHIGKYLCLADNGIGVAIKNFTLNLNFSPICSFYDHRVGQAANIGAPISATCFVQGFPPAEIEWYIQRHPKAIKMVPSNRVTFDRTEQPLKQYVMSQIFIHNVTESDYGQYICQASNSQGACENSVTFYRTNSCQEPCESEHIHSQDVKLPDSPEPETGSQNLQEDTTQNSKETSTSVDIDKNISHHDEKSPGENDHHHAHNPHENIASLPSATAFVTLQLITLALTVLNRFYL